MKKFRAKIYKQGQYLVCTFKHNKKTHTISTGLKILKGERWEHEQQRIVTSNRDKAYLLQHIKTHFHKAIPEYKLTGDKTLLKVPMVPTRAMAQEETILTALDQYAKETGKNKLTIKTIASKMKDYREPKLRRYFNLQTFYNYLLKSGSKVSTANVYCTTINTATKWKWSQEYKLNKQKSIGKVSWCLLEDEIQKLWSLEPRLKTHKTCLNISKGIYYSLQRFSDLMELAKAYQSGDVETGFLISKTSKSHTVIITDKLKTILPDIQNQYLQDFNIYIKEIAKEAGLDRRVGGVPVHELISSHIFRKSGASHLEWKGHSVVKLSNLLTHSNLTVTTRYLLENPEDKTNPLDDLV